MGEDGILSSALAGRGMVSDWDHVVQICSWLRYRLPQRRVVYLLGGSATRESVASEGAWAAQLTRLTGQSATTFVLRDQLPDVRRGPAHREALPRYRGSVLISVGISRFNMLHLPAVLPSYAIRRTAPVPWNQHHFDLPAGPHLRAETSRRARLAGGQIPGVPVAL